MTQAPRARTIRPARGGWKAKCAAMPEPQDPSLLASRLR
jgi:hypothetical protein